MSRLLDPRICPDCRARLDAEGVCTGCGLRLRGPLATQLWTTMQTADRLVEQLRTEVREPQPAGRIPAPSSTPATPAPTASAPSLPPEPPLSPQSAPPSAPRRLPAMSVQVVLLGLGALCLLVAAVVFVAVAWSDLGLGGRALILLGVTVGLGATAAALTHRGLRGAAETFWMVVALMLTIDIASAHTAGLFGLDTLSWRGATALVGVGLLLVGLGAPLWARTQPVARLLGPQALAVLGATLVVVPEGWLASHPAAATTVAVVVLVLGGLLLRSRVAVAAVGLVGVGGLSWLMLLGLGCDRALESSVSGWWWHSTTGWPLVAAAVTAGAATALPRTVAAWRAPWALGCLVAAGVFVHGPSSAATPSVVLTCVILICYIAVSRLAGASWRWPAACLSVPLLLALGALLFVRPLLSVEPGSFGAMRAGAAYGHGASAAASWRHVLIGATVALSVWALEQLLAQARRRPSRAPWGALLGIVLTGLLVPLLEARGPLWLAVVAVLVCLTLSAAATVAQRRHRVTLAAGGAVSSYLLLVLVLVAASSHLLSALAVGTVVVVLIAAYAVAERRAAGSVAAAGAGGLAVLLGGYVLAQALAARAAELGVLAVALACLAGAVGVAAGWLSRSTTSRITLEVSVVPVAFPALAFSRTRADVAVTLAVLGSMVALLAALRRDRAAVAWAAVPILALAAYYWGELVLTRTEYAVLPAGLLLLGLGGWGLRGTARVADGSRFGAGLLVVLAPSVVGGMPPVVDALLTTLVAIASAVGYALQERLRSTPLAQVLAVAAGGLGTSMVLRWLELGHLDADVRGLSLAVYAAAVGVAAAAISLTTRSRVTLEVLSVVVGVLACAEVSDLKAAAMALTIIGTAVAVVAVLHRDRAYAGWASMAVLGLATVFRVVAEVGSPELYTLPAALLLLGAGLWRVRTDSSIGSVSAMGSGLTLALVPSLMLTWQDPASLRGLLLGLGSVAVLAVGIRLRLSAPFVAGALVTALLAVRHLEPLAHGLPRWVVLGGVGLALLGVGITWEARLKDLRRGRAYVGGLR